MSAASISTRIKGLERQIQAIEDDDYLTREEVVSAVCERGYRFSKDLLHSWEYLGVLPKAVRRRYRGATRSVYQREIVDVIELVYMARAVGVRLSSLKDASDPATLRDIRERVDKQLERLSLAIQRLSA